MATADDIWNSWAVRLGVIATLFAVIAYGVDALDSRYAQASDISALVKSLNEGRMERLENEIRQAERRIQRVKMIPEESRTAWDLQDLQDALNEKEFLLRQLERLMDDR